MSINTNKKINTSPDSNIIKQEVLRALSKIMSEKAMICTNL